MQSVENPMCYSAQIWADFRKYERFGGKFNVKKFTKLAGWTKKKGNWVKVMRCAMTDATSGLLDICRWTSSTRQTQGEV
jgi:hypothetical protein